MHNIWLAISNYLYVPHTEQEYKHLVALMDELIDEVKEDENHSLASLMELIGALIEGYESIHVPELENLHVEEVHN